MHGGDAQRRATSGELRQIAQYAEALIEADKKRREPIAYEEVRRIAVEAKGIGSGILRRLAARWKHLLDSPEAKAPCRCSIFSKG